jgi:hypothetical protein
MRPICRVVFTLTALLFFAPFEVYGQAFENISSVLFSGGASVPSGDLGDAYGAGPFGRITYRTPVSETIHLGLETGVTGPSADVNEFELLQIPIRLLAIFPIAGEAASTPFLAIGGGATINSESIKASNGSESNTKVYLTYTVQLGYALRPEAMESTLFDLYIRYEQQVINDQSDFRNIDIGVGVGLCF